jgi:integrase
MSDRKAPGLQKRAGVWHIDKKVRGYGRLCETTGSTDYAEAERYLARRLEEIRQATVYGVRPERTFSEAAQFYIQYKGHKRSIRQDAIRLNGLSPFIGSIPISKLHMGSLKGYLAECQAKGLKSKSINHGLKVVRQILNLAATEWVDEHGLTWLERAPKIKLIPEHDARPPRPVTWDEQARFFQELPPHLERMALFVVNTGLRDTECTQLRWEWECQVRGLEYSVFLLPSTAHKAGHMSGQERLVILNRIAQSVLEEQRGVNPEYVFTYRGEPIQRLVNTAWDKARLRAGMDVRAHDLRHTYAKRLRAAGVRHEDIQDLLGHKNRNITAHYSRAEIGNLIEAANLVCERDGKRPELALIRKGQCA